ncbi:MAG: hypothetical protein EOO10_13985 [Chitinophagaceae bacterium]|nr:MAG: hypothetical protein EOO10_13985 [Chitinophagaceae bacterium]
MLVIAHHNISDPEGFWAGAKEVTKNLPLGMKVHGIFPAKDGKTGTCLWEAENVQEVQAFLDKNASQFAKNFCYEVNVEQSVGLPKFQLEESGVS